MIAWRALFLRQEGLFNTYHRMWVSSPILHVGRKSSTNKLVRDSITLSLFLTFSISKNGARPIILFRVFEMACEVTPLG